MIHRSIGNVSTVTEEPYITRGCLTLERFRLLTLYMSSWMAKQVITLKHLRLLPCPVFFDTNLEPCCLVAISHYYYKYHLCQILPYTLEPVHQILYLMLNALSTLLDPLFQHSSAMTLVSVRNTRVFRTALTALMEPRTLRRRFTCFPSPRQRVWVYWTDVVSFRCTWEHLGAPWITVEQSGTNIIFGNAAGAPGNHSYYSSFNDFQNLCIQFVFSSMYLCINIATYPHTVYLDCQHARIVSNLRCSCK